MIDFPYEWIALPVLLAGSATCSASETALFSLDDAERRRAGEHAQRLMTDPQAVLITLLFANLIVNVLFFALASRLGSEEAGYGAVGWGLGALLAIVLFGELLPKTLALQSPVTVARLAGPPIAFLVAATTPVRRVLQMLLEAAMRALGDVARHDEGITTDALAVVLESSANQGLIEVSEADLLAEVIELEGIRVREIMTPRVDMLAIDLAKEEDDNIQVVARALARRMTWLPAIREHADEVVGSIRMRDLLARPEVAPEKLVEPVRFVPEVASVLDLLRTLREARATEAVVIDEYGGTAGIVTIENIFEEIVGDLRVEGEEPERPVVALGEGRFRVSGGLSIRDWNEQFGREVVPAGFETVGGFVTALLGRIPRAGDVVRQGGLVSLVHEVRGRRVRSVDMFIEAPAETAS